MAVHRTIFSPRPINHDTMRIYYLLGEHMFDDDEV